MCCVLTPDCGQVLRVIFYVYYTLHLMTVHLFSIGGVVLNVFPMGMDGQWWSYFSYGLVYG